MKGKTVITSKESVPYVLAIEKLKDTPYEASDKKSMITWTFKTENEAIENANLFMHLGFEYVKRI